MLHNAQRDAVSCAALFDFAGLGSDPSLTAASRDRALARDLAPLSRHVLDTISPEPGYGFVTNKGYYTPEHVDALQRLGPCLLHRRSFSPVKEMVAAPTPSLTPLLL